GGAAPARPRPAPGRGRQRPLRLEDRHRVRQSAVAVRPVLVRGSGRPAGLRAAGRTGAALRPADGNRREPVLDAGCAQPDPLRRHAARSRLAAVRLRPELWPGGISAHAGHAQGPWLVAGALHPARRPPDVAGDRGRAGPGRQRVVSRPVPAIRGLSRWRESGGQLRDAAGLARDRLRGQERPLCGDEGAGGVNTKLWVRWFSAVSLILVLWGVAFALFGLGILPVERKVL